MHLVCDLFSKDDHCSLSLTLGSYLREGDRRFKMLTLLEKATTSISATRILQKSLW